MAYAEQPHWRGTGYILWIFYLVQVDISSNLQALVESTASPSVQPLSSLILDNMNSINLPRLDNFSAGVGPH
jgi:hypothetical protein